MAIVNIRRTLARVYRGLFPRRAAVYATCAHRLRNARAFEVGGPSQIFGRGGLLPIYPLLASLDNSNYSNRTVWEGEIEEGMTFRFDRAKPLGRALIREGTDLHGVDSESYDAVLSSHTLEHIANPLRALKEWTRLLKPGGSLVLIVPHREGTFDHRRPVTRLQHLIEDEEAGCGEDDQTHVEEILALHDLDRDPLAGSMVEFRDRSLRNHENRCLHHHVFDAALVAEVLDHVGLQIVGIEARRPFHIIAIATKQLDGSAADNSSFLRADAAFRMTSPFAGDHTEPDQS